MKFTNFPQVFKCTLFFHKIFGYLPLTISFEAKNLKWKTTFLDRLVTLASIVFFFYAFQVNIAGDTFSERIDNKLTTCGFRVLRIFMALDSACRPFICFIHRKRLAMILKNICVADKKVTANNFSFKNYILFIFEVAGRDWNKDQPSETFHRLSSFDEFCHLFSSSIVLFC